MKEKEFRPLPDEFNLGYVPPVKEEEEEKKKKKRRQLRKLLMMAAVLFIIFPLVLDTGLFHKAEPQPENVPPPVIAETPAPVVTPEPTPTPESTPTPVPYPHGTFVSGETYVHLEEEGSWFFNGRYFIPLSYDTETLAYHAAGAYPAEEGMALTSTVYYVTSDGTVEEEGGSLRLFDTFTQETVLFAPSDASFHPAYLDAELTGGWQGMHTPAADYPMAYIKSMTLASETLMIIVGDNQSENQTVYSGSYALEDGVLKTSFDLPIVYQIVMADQIVECRFEQDPEGIVFYTEDGCFLFLNIFSSQLFTR